MKNKLFIFTWLVYIITIPTEAQVLTLDSCRTLAIKNNKELKISQERIKSAYYQKKAAFTDYLPKITGIGGYLRSQKEMSILNNSQKEALGSIGTKVNGTMHNGVHDLLTQMPELSQDPQFTSIIQKLGNVDIATPLNEMGNSLIDAFRTDTHNIYEGGLTLTQPLYIGGKIRAYNKITKYAEELAKQQHSGELQNLILSTDQAYWQTVSLSFKKKLAVSYLNLLKKLESDINKMVNAGLATRSDELSVKVKENEAEIVFTKVDDGLSLSRMLLCQLCGLDLSSPIILKDEQTEDINSSPLTTKYIDIKTIYAMRPEIRSLELSTNIYKQKIRITRADFLPSLTLVGNYIITNPSLFNGFEKKLKGMWSIGLTLKIPVLNWGESKYKVKSAQAEERMAVYRLNDAKEKIELQVNQSIFKVNEALKKLIMTKKNMEKANENLRCANLGFREGLITTSNLLEAHTAWISAQSEKIDAQIDMKLADTYLQKSLGRLNINN